MSTNGILDFQGTNKATFVGENSNVVIDTVNASFGIGVDVNGPTSNLHVVGNAYVTSNLEVGTANLFVDTVSGRVGIGKTDPGATLDVVGDVDISSNLAVGTANLFVDTVNSRVGIGTNAPDGNLHITSGTSGDCVLILEADTDNSYENDNPRIEFRQDGGTAESAILQSDNYLDFKNSVSTLSGIRFFTGGDTSGYTNATERMRIAGNGDVGIGTNDPLGRLDVRGAIIAPVVSYLSNQDAPYLIAGTPGYTGAATNWDTHGFQHRIKTNSGGTPRITVDAPSGGEVFSIVNGGNIGIGTTNPTAQLHISSGNSGDCVLKIEADEDNNDELDNPRIEFITDGGYNTALVGAGQMPFETTNDNALVLAALQMKFYTGSVQDFTDSTTMTERMRILSNGNVGIGTSSPNAQLHVNGESIFGSSGASSIVINDIPQARWKINTGGYALAFSKHNSSSDEYSTWSEKVRIDQNGNVGIGKTDPDAKLHVNGNAIIGDVGGYATNGYTDAQLTLGGTHNTNLYNQDDQIKLLISGGNNDGGSPYYIMCEDENGNDQFYVKGGNTASGDNGVTYVRGVVGIKQTSPSYTLDVNGTIRYTSSGSSASDDRIKYNEEDISSPLALISQLKPQKYEKIMEFPNPSEGTWIPTDEEWETAKDEYKYGDEFGFIAQDIHNIPELKFLVSGEETKMEMKTVSLEEYSNLTTEERSTYTTPVYMYISTEDTISMEQYSNLTSEVQQTYTQSISGYTKEIETQTPLSLNYQGLFVVAIGAIKELKTQLATVLARLDALENA